MTARRYSGTGTAGQASQPAVPLGRGRTLAATQLAIMEAEIGLPEPFAYTLVSAVRATGLPDWQSLLDAIRVAIGRHDVFSWRLTLDSAYQVAAAGGGSPHFELEQVDLRAATPADAEAAVGSRLRHERRRRIRLLGDTETPYTRLIAFRMPAQDTNADAAVCALVTHHILVDEHATELIWNEIFQRAAGRNLPAGYDRRYADWSQASVSTHAETASRQAAREVAGPLLDVPLGTIPRLPANSSDEDSWPQMRLVIPASLTTAAATRAAAIAVPVTAVYAAAFTEAVTARTSTRNLAITVYVTRRKTVADLDVVGCFISAVPMLARAAPAGEAGQDTVLRSYRALQFASGHAHADAGTIRAAVGHAPQVSLAFESPRTRRAARPISWTSIPPPDSVPKHDLSIFLSPGTRDQPGAGHLLWRPGVLNDASAGMLAAEFLAHMRRLAGDT